MTHTVAPPSVAARGSRRFAMRRETRAALLFVAPAALGFSVFTLLPAIRGVYYSFTDFDVFQPAKLIGTGNYERLFADAVFWNALKVTLEYVVINIGFQLSLIHISEPTRQAEISYAVLCLKKK